MAKGIGGESLSSQKGQLLYHLSFGSPDGLNIEGCVLGGSCYINAGNPSIRGSDDDFVSIRNTRNRTVESFLFANRKLAATIIGHFPEVDEAVVAPRGQ